MVDPKIYIPRFQLQGASEALEPLNKTTFSRPQRPKGSNLIDLHKWANPRHPDQIGAASQLPLSQPSTERLLVAATLQNALFQPSQVESSPEPVININEEQRFNNHIVAGDIRGTLSHPRKNKVPGKEFHFGWAVLDCKRVTRFA